MSAADDLLIEPSSAQAGQSAAALPDSGNPDIAAWLQWLAELLPAARCIALLRFDRSGEPLVLSCHPASSALPDVSKVLASRAYKKGSRQRLLAGEPAEQLLALPLQRDPDSKSTTDVLLLVCNPLTEQQQGTLLGLVNWALHSLNWVDKPQGSLRPGLCNTQAMVSPIGIQRLLDKVSSQHAGAQCALTWMKRARHVRYKACVVGISGQRVVDPSRTAVRKLASFMESVLVRTSPEPVPVYEAGPSSGEGSDALPADPTELPVRFVVPMQVHDELLFFSLCRPAGQTLSTTTRDQLEQELVPAFQAAWLLREVDAPIREIAWRRALARLRQRAHRKATGAAQLVLLVCALILVLYPVDKRVSAEVNVEAAERHALIAPMDGFVKSVHARAGDRVAQGDLLATLDDGDLLRQADKWVAEEQKNQQDYLSALAMHDRVELSTLRENRVLIQTELEQVRAQLARHELRAPIAGIVLSDSVEDALGSAVKAGQILFEVGSAEQYRLALQVPERRIESIVAGQSVTLRMTADPKQRRQARVEMVIPIATASQGENTFKVYALPDGQEGLLRPGMKGIGKVLVGRASRLSQWTESFWARCVWLAWKLGLGR